MKNMYAGHQFFLDEMLTSYGMSPGNEKWQTQPQDLEEFSVMQ